MTQLPTVEQARHALVQHGQLPSKGLKEPLVDSWGRCLNLGIDPSCPPQGGVVPEDRIRDARRDCGGMLEHALHELEQLHELMPGKCYVTAFLSPDSVAISTIQDLDFQASDAGKAIVPGTVWTEEHQGTNAIGMSAALRKPVRVHGLEHFLQAFGGVTCIGAPVFDEKNRVAGFFGIAADIRSYHSHSLGLAAMAAAGTENRRFRESHRSAAMIVSLHPRREYLGTMSAGLIAIDESGRIIGSTSRAKELVRDLGGGEPREFADVFAGRFADFADRVADGAAQVVDHGESPVYVSQTGFARKVSAAGWESPPLAGEPAFAGEPLFDDALVRRQIRVAGKAIKSGLPILVEGEPGTGKNELARAIHARHGGGELVTVDCRRFSERAFHRRLARVSASPPAGADAPQRGCTVLFSEVANLSKAAQKALVAFLDGWQSGSPADIGDPVGAAIFTTNRKVERLAEKGALGGDLLERVSGLRIELPPLALRADFDGLARRILSHVSAEHTLSERLLGHLRSLKWPGNVRQLKRSLQLMVTHAERKLLDVDLVPHLDPFPGGQPLPCPSCAGSLLKEQRCLQIRRMWRESGGNVSLVADRLGLSRTTVYSHLRRHPQNGGGGGVRAPRKTGR